MAGLPPFDPSQGAPALTRRALRAAAQPVFLLTIYWGSKPLRLSSAPVEIDTDDGGRLRFVGGLPEVPHDATFDLFSESSSMPEVSFQELYLPADVAHLVFRLGYDPARATGEYAVWLPGTTWESRLVLVSGRVHDPTFGGADDPVALSLRSLPLEDRVPLLPAGWRVTSTTWPSAASSAVDKAGPFVWGRPGAYTTAGGATGSGPGSPAWMVDTTSSAEKLLAAYHPTQAGQAGSIVQVYASDGTNDGLNASHGADANGVPVTLIDLSSPGALTVDATLDYYIGWSGDDGALLDGERLVEGLGDLVVYLGRRSGARLDMARLRAAAPALNIPSGSYVDDPSVYIWAWITGNVLPILDASTVHGPQGLYLEPWHLGARLDDVAARFTTGPGFVREGPIQTEGTRDVVDAVQLRFAVDVEAGEHKRTKRYGADRPEAGDSSLLHSRLALLTSADPAASTLHSVESDLIYTDGAADRVGLAQAVRRSASRHVLTYRCGVEHAWVQPGALVALTDDELYLTNRLAVARPRALTASALLFDFILIPSPLRDVRDVA